MPTDLPLRRDNVAILVPALNEQLRIAEVVRGCLQESDTVIVVDDGSTDDTVACLAGLPVTVLRHAQRQGKGAALRTGFSHALSLGMAGVVTLDGDGQHSAADIPRLLDAANRHPGNIIIGARLRNRAAKPPLRRMANEFGDWGIAWGTGYQVADSQSGQRFYPAQVMALRDVPGEDFVFEAQIVISAARQLGVGCVSVPIESRYAQSHAPQQFRRSHFRPLRDLWRITSHIVLQAVRRGGLLDVYRQVQATPAVIDDPSGEFSQPPLSPRNEKLP